MNVKQETGDLDGYWCIYIHPFKDEKITVWIGTEDDLIVYRCELLVAGEYMDEHTLYTNPVDIINHWWTDLQQEK